MGRGLHGPVKDRFEKFVMPEPNTGCHFWLGHVNNHGYGTFGLNRTHVYAHRFAWEQERGPIPPGMDVCHSCDTPSCVNPDHHFLGTRKENMADCVAKDRNNRGERCGTAKLSAAQIEAIRADARSQSRIAADYGMSQSQVSRIKGRQRWRHIEG